MTQHGDAADFLPAMDDSVPRIARRLLEGVRAARCRRGTGPIDPAREAEFLAQMIEILT